MDKIGGLSAGGSTKVGLGLWQCMPMARVFDAPIVLVGLWIFVVGANLSRSKKLWFAVPTLLSLHFAIAGMTIVEPMPSITAMASGSLVTMAVVRALAGWLGKRST